MITQSATYDDQATGDLFEHAVVIGSSIAGLMAARVLTDYFARVTIIERDRLPDTPEFRPGVPQARHAHSLPLRGQLIMERHFPGLTGELLAGGATAIDAGSELALFMAGEWHNLHHYSVIMSTTFSRPLLETTIYRRVADHPRVHILQEHQVLGLTVDRAGERATGVRLRQRHGPPVGETELAADLVVDASGRDSRAPEWLSSMGYTPPEESTVDALAGYATRIYRRPAHFTANWKAMHVKPTAPDSPRGGVILPVEGNRWYVSLMGMGGDYPPTDEEGFLAFARSLPVPDLYQAIVEAEPLSKVAGYRRTENQVRHYDRLPRYLDGFLVYGDAVYTLNPIYAQGMTAAALGSLALARSLKTLLRQGAAGSTSGLARSFHKQLSSVVASPWRMVIREDLRWPATQATGAPLVAPHRPASFAVSRRPAAPWPYPPARQMVHGHAVAA